LVKNAKLKRHDKWMTADIVQGNGNFLQLVAGTVLDLNREELGHQEGHPPSLAN
jgi:hypothetical protein